MEEQPLFVISEKRREDQTSCVRVYLGVTGTFNSPMTKIALEALERVAYRMPFRSPSDLSKTVYFSVSLPADNTLNYQDALAVDAAIFTGLIKKGRKGSESVLDRFPPNLQGKP